MLLRLPDPDAQYSAVRLTSDLPAQDFARHNGEWRLEFDRADVERLEYQLEVEHDDGATEYVLDPGNPNTAPGAFGDKSVLLLPTYEPPAWLDAPHVEGEKTKLAVRRVQTEVWSPADTDPDEPLPLLVAHDGPEYDLLSQLTRFSAVKIAAGELPPHRVALLAPRERDEWYSASPRYTRMLMQEVLPKLPPTHGAPAAIGASLGALALLYAQRRHPGTFGALFLQSGSFFMPRYDAHESRFPHYHRVVGFVGETLRAGRARRRPHRADLRSSGGEHPQQSRDGRDAAGPAARADRHPQLHGLARRVRPAPRAPARRRVVTGRHAELYSPAIGSSGSVVAYGHWGRPVLAFPAEGGSAWDLEHQGMVGAVADLIEGGRVKLYAVDAFDAESWSNQGLPLEERARNHERYESWIVEQVVPHIQADSHTHDIATLGVSLGAYHAVNFALKRADLFPLAIGLLR